MTTTSEHTHTSILAAGSLLGGIFTVFSLPPEILAGMFFGILAAVPLLLIYKPARTTRKPARTTRKPARTTRKPARTTRKPAVRLDLEQQCKALGLPEF